MIWAFQILLDVCLVALAVAYILQGRRLLALEKDLRRTLQKLATRENNDTSVIRESAKEVIAVASSEIEAINTPLGETTSTLSERKASDMRAEEVNHSIALSQSSKYALARKLLAEGLPLNSVAQKSGLSEAELALLGKISSSVHRNNRLH